MTEARENLKNPNQRCIYSYIVMHIHLLATKQTILYCYNSQRNMIFNLRFFTEKSEKILNMALYFSQENHHSSVRNWPKKTEMRHQVSLFWFDYSTRYIFFKDAIPRAVHCHREMSLSDFPGLYSTSHSGMQNKPIWVNLTKFFKWKY